MTAIGEPVRRRADDRAPDQGRGPRRRRADRVGRCRDDEARGQGRVRPSQAGRPGRRAAGRGGGVPRATPDLTAVGRRRANRASPSPTTGSARSAISRRSRRTSSSAGSASTARRSSRERAASMPIRCMTATRRSRSATSTPSTSTRTTARPSSGPSSGWPTGSPPGCGPPGSRAGTVAVKIRDSSFRTITRQRTLAEPTDMTEPIYRAALELARPEVRGIRVRLLGVTASNLGDREQLAMFSDEDPASTAGDGRGGCRPPALRRRRRHPRPPAGCRAAGAVRARSAQPAGPPRPRRPERSGRPGTRSGRP